jgi:glycosyltransferase involved in cell wall biosynthesis
MLFEIPNSVRFHIYHFVSILADLPKLSFSEIRKKYNLPEKYFMISNQFHKHKNHKVVFEAFAKINKRNPQIHVAITVRFPHEPNSPYMKELHEIVDTKELRENISNLGLIPREEQLLLMKYSQAITQPSFFEGWSTVFEDAQSLQVPVIASNLPVNIEQLQEKGTYFEPHDYMTLANLLENYPNRKFGINKYEKYAERMKSAAYVFMKIFNDKQIS